MRIVYANKIELIELSIDASALIIIVFYSKSIANTNGSKLAKNGHS